MYREILIEVTPGATKAAVLEEGKLVEVYVEREQRQRLVGNIYKGIVQNVLPGMQAAFVDIGLEKNAFLYVQDVVVPSEVGQPNIRDVVREGQEIVVQIVKEPVGSKGARITTKITLPGRYLVLMPFLDHVGISRRIVAETERERLREIAARLKREQLGLIVRTNGEGAAAEILERDLHSLLKIWGQIVPLIENTAAPMLLHRDLELVPRILRDIFNDDVQKLRVNSRPAKEKIIAYLDLFDLALKNRVYLGNIQQLFVKYNFTAEIRQALQKKVWLKNGGYLVIDETEALTVIDVNTGKFIGATDLADTVVRTNCTAAREIIRQLRLRNIGGIIIIDFIDMNLEEHRQKVLDILAEEAKKDKVKTHILGLTALGFVEMTRKKIRPSLSETLEVSCLHCEGTGKNLLPETEIGFSFF